MSNQREEAGNLNQDINKEDANKQSDKSRKAGETGGQNNPGDAEQLRREGGKQSSESGSRSGGSNQSNRE